MDIKCEKVDKKIRCSDISFPGDDVDDVDAVVVYTRTYSMVIDCSSNDVESVSVFADIIVVERSNGRRIVKAFIQ